MTGTDGVAGGNHITRRLRQPVAQLAMDARDWLQWALAAHPERQVDLDALSQRVDVACGELSDGYGVFVDLATVNGIAHALREIAAVMWDVVPYLPPSPGHSH